MLPVRTRDFLVKSERRGLGHHGDRRRRIVDIVVEIGRRVVKNILAPLRVRVRDLERHLPRLRGYSRHLSAEDKEIVAGEFKRLVAEVELHVRGNNIRDEHAGREELAHEALVIDKRESDLRDRPPPLLGLDPLRDRKARALQIHDRHGASGKILTVNEIVVAVLDTRIAVKDRVVG